MKPRPYGRGFIRDELCSSSLCRDMSHPI